MTSAVEFELGGLFITEKIKLIPYDKGSLKWDNSIAEVIFNNNVVLQKN